MAGIARALSKELEREERRRGSLVKQATESAKASELTKFATLITSNLHRIAQDAITADVQDWLTR